MLPGSGGTAFSPGTWEARQVDLLSSRPIWSIQQVPEQPWLQKKKILVWGWGHVTKVRGGGGESRKMLNVKQTPRCTFAPFHPQA